MVETIVTTTQKSISPIQYKPYNAKTKDFNVTPSNIAIYILNPRLLQNIHIWITKHLDQ